MRPAAVRQAALNADSSLRGFVAAFSCEDNDFGRLKIVRNPLQRCPFPEFDSAAVFEADLINLQTEAVDYLS